MRRLVVQCAECALLSAILALPALAADVDRTFVSQMERGIRQPTITTLMKLAGALGIQPSTLVARMEKLLR